MKWDVPANAATMNAIEREGRTATVLAEKTQHTLIAHLPWIVALLTFVLGMVYMAFAPVGHIPDIWEHVYRISGILNGDVMARPVDAQSDFHRSAENVGGRVDQMWIDYSIAHFDNYDFGVVDPASITVRDGDTAEVPYNNTAVNTPVAYAPQLLAFATGRAIGLDAGATYQLAQFVMLAVYAIAMGFAVAVLPRYRVPMALVLLLPPLTFRYSFAISADSFTQAVAILYICLLFRLAFPGNEEDGAAGVHRRSLASGEVKLLAVLLVLGMVLAFTKFTYAPLVAVSAGLLWMRRLSRGQAAAVIAGIAIPICASLTWVKSVGWFVTTPGISSSAQVAEKAALITEDPLRVASDIVSAILRAQANNAGNSLVMVVVWLLVLAVIAVLVLATAKRALPANRLAFWWFAIAVCLAIIAATYLALWLQYTPIDVPGVNGIQFRYFNPLAPLFAFVALDSLVALRTRRRGVARRL